MANPDAEKNKELYKQTVREHAPGPVTFIDPDEIREHKTREEQTQNIIDQAERQNPGQTQDWNDEKTNHIRDASLNNRGPGVIGIEKESNAPPIMKTPDEYLDEKPEYVDRMTGTNPENLKLSCLETKDITKFFAGHETRHISQEEPPEDTSGDSRNDDLETLNREIDSDLHGGLPTTDNECTQQDIKDLRHLGALNPNDKAGLSDHATGPFLEENSPQPTIDHVMAPSDLKDRVNSVAAHKLGIGPEEVADMYHEDPHFYKDVTESLRDSGALDKHPEEKLYADRYLEAADRQFKDPPPETPKDAPVNEAPQPSENEMTMKLF